MNRLLYILCLMVPGFLQTKTSSVFLFGPGDCTVELSRGVAQEYSSVLAAKITQREFTLDCSMYSEEILNTLSTFFDLVEKQETSTWHGMDFLIQNGPRLLGIAHYLGLKDLLIQKLSWGQQAANKLA